MKNWIQPMLELGRFRPQRKHFSANSLPMLLVLAGLVIWAPTRAEAQIFDISHVDNFSVLVSTPVTIGLSLTNTTGVSGPVQWSLTSTPASDATIAPTNTLAQGSTIFTWTPIATQQVTFTVIATQPGSVNVAGTSFTITVTNLAPVATPPVLTLPFSTTNITVGATLAFAAFATNTDGSSNALTFSLSTNAVALGATITNSTANTGLFRWTPAAGGLYNMSVIVSEANTTLSATQSFAVNVLLINNCNQLGDFLAAVAEGGHVVLTNCPTLVLSNTIIVERPVSIEAPLTNVTIAGNNLVRLFIVASNASLTLNGITLMGGQSDSGGAIYIVPTASVEASNCVFAGNGAVGANGFNGPAGPSDPNYGRNGSDAAPGQAGAGGAILNLGSFTAISCQFTNNRAIGGNGGSGGDGSSALYRGGNGGNGGEGALGFGGAIYNAGEALSLTDCTFSGNVAVGGNGGFGGTNGNQGRIFPGYPGTGGAGSEGSGGAIYSLNTLSLLRCTISGNTAHGGDSAPGGEAGGGHGVNGAPGGPSFGGGACLLAPGVLTSCAFSNDTATGGNGGDGGSGTYGGGNGGDGGEALGGCLYNIGGATLQDTSFSVCTAVGGNGGAAGSGFVSGKLGQIRSSISNAVNNITLSNIIFATAVPGGPMPAALAPGGYPLPQAGLPGATGNANSLQPAAGTGAGSAAAVSVAPLSAANPAATNVPSAGPVTIPSSGPPAPPAPGAGPSAVPRKPFTQLAGPPGVIMPANRTNAAVAAPPAASSPMEAPLPAGMIDFRAADLNQVLEIYSLLVNRTILRPATLGAPTITLKTQGQLTVGEGIQALEAVLALNGVTMVRSGDKFVKAVPEAQSGSAAAQFDTNNAALYPELGQYVTHVVQLKYAKPTEMVQILTPYMKVPNAVLAVDSSQMLVLRDYTENVKRMLEMIEKVDVVVPSDFDSVVIPIKYAKAAEIAGALNSLSSGGGGTSVGGGGGATTTRSTRSSSSGINRSTGTTGYPGQGIPGMGVQPGATTPTPAASSGSSFSSRLQNIINRASGPQGEITVLGQTKIISDERTNSLLIYASKEDMKTIKKIVAELDVVLAQVLIEAVIISVTISDSRDLGVSYLQHPQNAGPFTGVGAINNKNLLQLNNFSGINGVTNASGILPSGFSYLMSFNQDLDVAVTAAAADSRAKILQRPRIQTSHNEPASLFVGENRPYPTSSYYGGGAYGGYSSIQQLQIGVTLEVTPLINPDGLVVMDIHQKIDSFEGNVTIQNVGDVPVTSSKEAQAKVSVRDHDTIILGGLIETDKNKSASGVPFLMDVPLLGYLFRASHNDEKRSELIVLIRPTVLPTPEIAALAASAEKNKMPGVRSTEKQIRDDDKARLKAADRAEKADLPSPTEKP